MITIVGPLRSGQSEPPTDVRFEILQRCSLRPNARLPREPQPAPLRALETALDSLAPFAFLGLVEKSYVTNSAETLEGNNRLRFEQQRLGEAAEREPKKRAGDGVGEELAGRGDGGEVRFKLCLVQKDGAAGGGRRGGGRTSGCGGGRGRSLLLRLGGGRSRRGGGGTAAAVEE